MESTISLLEKAVIGAQKEERLTWFFFFFFCDSGESSLKSYLSGQNLTAVRNEKGIFPSDSTSSRVGAEKHIPYVLHLIPGRDSSLRMSVI